MVGHLALEFGEQLAAASIVSCYNLTSACTLTTDLSATPCGEGGWFLDTYGICPGDYFAMCLKPAQDCYYLHDEDDCTFERQTAYRLLAQTYMSYSLHFDRSVARLVQRERAAQDAGHLVLVG